MSITRLCNKFLAEDIFCDVKPDLVSDTDKELVTNSFDKSFELCSQ